ncbi:MAG: hypothetical protein HC769_02890 [Cyanobacteria bacterium CRU_2_1]|nr:hypothetical protein [Cyanobacteria bacterium CRU_2_1]
MQAGERSPTQSNWLRSSELLFHPKLQVFCPFHCFEYISLEQLPVL